MTHGAAHRVALIARDSGTPPQADPIGALYSGRKAGLRPIHDKLIEVISEFGDGVALVPKKGCISVRRARQSARAFNALFTHRVRVRAAADIDADLLTWLSVAYQSAD